MAITPVGSTYSDSRYGIVRRAYTVPLTKDDVGTAGTLVEAFFVLPKRSTIRKFGIMSCASDVICTTTTSFELRLQSSGAKLATFVPGSAVGSGQASGAVPDTATTIAGNTPMVGCVGSVVGDSGSFYYFIDYTEDFDASS